MAAALRITALSASGVGPFQAVEWRDGDDFDRGLPRRMLVFGEIGVGKSRLMEWILAGLEILLDGPELHLDGESQVRLRGFLCGMEATRSGQIWAFSRSVDLYEATPRSERRRLSFPPLA